MISQSNELRQAKDQLQGHRIPQQEDLLCAGPQGFLLGSGVKKSPALYR